MDREFYGHDLAYIHDAGFGDVARAAAATLLKLLAARRIGRGLIVELGTGSGIVAERLSLAGYDVLASDLSAAMLALAQRRAPRATFRQQSLLDAEIPPCVAVAAVGEVFNYAADPRHSTRRLSALLRRIHAALPAGGLLLFDVATPGRVRGKEPQRRFFAGDDWAVLVEATERRAARELVRRITSFRRVGHLYRRADEEHVQRLFDPREIAALLRRLGFRVRTLRGYGALRFSPGVVAFMATKATT
ncbi:MAG TPA: class I SAM-dependent methyltransferase [Pirellulales bacterium]|nr:class I SAM-dependent methyltransferase [Pirellulales bacterium]